ncbi:MAG: hypothetical protein HOW73_12140 [Polyangiaceae bacterium]|nr:hypothetical protein [Polyangiaceae bacterium]
MSRWMKVALVALGLSVVPVSYALADNGDAAVAQGAKDGKKGNKKHFPMNGDQFVEKVDARMAKSKTRIDAKLDHKKVPADKQKEILSEFDRGSAKIHAAAVVAAKDGTVTADEAKSVRSLAKETRKAMREKYGIAKEGKGEGKGKKKGHKKGKGQPA